MAVSTKTHGHAWSHCEVSTNQITTSQNKEELSIYVSNMHQADGQQTDCGWSVWGWDNILSYKHVIKSLAHMPMSLTYWYMFGGTKECV